VNTQPERAADPDRPSTRDGRSTRWDPHRKERRLAIITAAVDAIEEFGPNALTGQIARRAGVPRTHVYRHFEGKRALDLAVSGHIASQLGDQLRAALSRPGSARDIIRAGIGEHLGWIEAHPNLYRFLARHAYAVRSTGSPEADDAKAAFAAELTALIERYLRVLGVSAQPQQRMVVGIVGLVDATAAWWLERGDATRDELTTELTARVWLLISLSAAELGLDLDPDQPLPAV
jgi:AcrR family transcriptional regulator